ncbi:hypothetical protein LEP1GSC158_1041 [Leptospira interrogans serovar Zanoni str. LT2156]|uniref:Uncharacterized protein n=3 Tax=Leptospira interrogans TaxID=173 RepID=M6HWP3_LEPIR|nr:hypothetical protein LEP1GSC158_1041 [Leptospira interrogans serovar Zanoni str. LT2156]
MFFFFEFWENRFNGIMQQNKRAPADTLKIAFFFIWPSLEIFYQKIGFYFLSQYKIHYIGFLSFI